MPCTSKTPNSTKNNASPAKANATPGSDKAQSLLKRIKTNVLSQSQLRYAEDYEDYMDSDFSLSGASLSAVESKDKMEWTENLDTICFDDTVRSSIYLYKD
eukprot:5585646-Ditylum_brightwellii.AAC.1